MIIVKIYNVDGTIQEVECEKESLEAVVHGVDVFAAVRIEIGDGQPKPCISFKDLPAALEAALIAETGSLKPTLLATHISWARISKNVADRVKDGASKKAAAMPTPQPTTRAAFILEDKATGEKKEVNEERVRYLCEHAYTDLDQAVEDLRAGGKLQTTASFLYVETVEVKDGK